MSENIIELDNVSADSLVVGDQIIVDGEYFIIHTLDADREDIDEVFVTGENLDGGDTEFSLYADDYYVTWAI